MHKTESVCKRYKLLVKDRKYLHNVKTIFNKTETLCENRTFFQIVKEKIFAKGRTVYKRYKLPEKDRHYLPTETICNGQKFYERLHIL